MTAVQNAIVAAVATNSPGAHDPQNLVNLLTALFSGVRQTATPSNPSGTAKP